MSAISSDKVIVRTSYQEALLQLRINELLITDIKSCGKCEFMVFSFKLKLYRTLQRHYSVIGSIKISWAEKN